MSLGDIAEAIDATTARLSDQYRDAAKQALEASATSGGAEMCAMIGTELYPMCRASCKVSSGYVVCDVKVIVESSGTTWCNQKQTHE